MAKAATTITMDDLLAQEDASTKQLTQGEVVTGKVLSVRKHEVLVDLGPQGIGLVPRREVGFSRSLAEGEEVSASIVDTELETGYALLSLRKAAKDKGWDELAAKLESGEIIEVSAYDANRGGLLVEYDGVRGFLPVSQLSAEHYPRVGSNDKDEILQRLNGLINQPLKVRILDADRKANKLIFSEKEAVKEGLAARFEKLKVGDSVTGVATGVVDYGIFVNVEGIEGLVHISEISWERVNNPSDYVKVGQTIEAKIIAIDKDRLSLSMKQLSEDPWMSEVDQFKAGQAVEGTVTRITPFGAFVQISPAVEALVHVSELGGGDSADPEKVFTLNERKEFVVLDIEKDNRKISLGLPGSKSAKKAN
ncbi:30S ribosomal protein S1 [Candidatus Saccharibacteria bacterium 32-49-12]|nr:MAG: 30S ribosomal protein S1 [Candidatus Saccharibacteria bacterium 32-49-12]